MLRSNTLAALLALTMTGAALVPTFAAAREARSSSEEQTSRLLARAEAAYARKDFDTAADLLEALTDRSDQPLAWYDYGNTLFMLARYQEAFRAYRRAMNAHGPLAILAGIYGARSLHSLGQVAKARELLDGLVEQAREDGLVDAVEVESRSLESDVPLATAVLAYDAGEYARAEVLATDAIVASELQPEAYALRGLTYLQVSKITAAHDDFQRVAATAGEQTVRADASTLAHLTAVSAASVADGFWALVDVAGGSDSNVFSDATDAGSTRLGFAQAAGAVEYALSRSSAADYEIGYSLEDDEKISASMLRSQTHNVYLGAAYDGQALGVTFRPAMEFWALGDSAMMRREGLRTNWRYKVENGEFGLDFDIMKNVATSDRYSYMGGSSGYRRIYWQHTYSRVSVGVGVIDDSEHLSDLALPGGSLSMDRVGIGPELRLRVVPSVDWDAVIDAVYLWNTFTTPSFSVPKRSAVARAERLLDARARVTRRLGQRLGIYGSVEIISNVSNLGANTIADRSYGETILGGGVTWYALP